MKNLIRRYKISKAINEPLEGKDKEIINYLELTFSNIILFYECEDETRNNYLNKNGEFLLQHVLKDDKIFVPEIIFLQLENIYNIKPIYIENILQNYIFYILKIKSDDVRTVRFAQFEIIETEYRIIQNYKRRFVK